MRDARCQAKCRSRPQGPQERLAPGVLPAEHGESCERTTDKAEGHAAVGNGLRGSGQRPAEYGIDRACGVEGAAAVVALFLQSQRIGLPGDDGGHKHAAAAGVFVACVETKARIRR
jgi:hypothetical protein